MPPVEPLKARRHSTRITARYHRSSYRYSPLAPVLQLFSRGRRCLSEPSKSLPASTSISISISADPFLTVPSLFVRLAYRISCSRVFLLSSSAARRFRLPVGSIFIRLLSSPDSSWSPPFPLAKKKKKKERARDRDGKHHTKSNPKKGTPAQNRCNLRKNQPPRVRPPNRRSATAPMVIRNAVQGT